MTYIRINGIIKPVNWQCVMPDNKWQHVASLYLRSLFGQVFCLLAISQEEFWSYSDLEMPLSLTLFSSRKGHECRVLYTHTHTHTHIYGLYSSWNSLGQNTRVGSLSLLQGIFPTQGSNPGLSHCRWILYHLSHRRSIIVITILNTCEFFNEWINLLLGCVGIIITSCMKFCGGAQAV